MKALIGLSILFSLSSYAAPMTGQNSNCASLVVANCHDCTIAKQKAAGCIVLDSNQGKMPGFEAKALGNKKKKNTSGI